jgi:hypothetical protein
MERGKSGWEKEFTEFSSTEPTEVPALVSAAILQQVTAELHPSAIKVFSKTASIHAVVGLLTLLFCPQFGLSLSSSMGLMPYLMKYGEGVCMLGCGAFFTGISLLVASVMLRPEEVRALKEHQILQLAFLSTASLGAFVCLGGEVVLSLGLIWALGAIVGGALTLEAGWAYRRRIAYRSLA